MQETNTLVRCLDRFTLNVKKLKAQVPATAHRRVPPTAHRRVPPTAATAPRATNPRVMRRVGSSSTYHAGEHTRVVPTTARSAPGAAR